MKSVAAKITNTSQEGQYQPPVQPREQDERIEKVASNKILENLASSSSPLIYAQDPSGNHRELDQLAILNLRDQFTEKVSPPKKGRKRRKKKKKASTSVTIPSSSSAATAASSSVSSSLFKVAIQAGSLPRDFGLFSNEENALLQEVLDGCQLGGSVSLMELLGLEMDICYSNLIELAPKLKSPLLTNDVKEKKCSFEALFILIFTSLLAEYEALECPEMKEYLDDRHLLTREKSLEVITDRIRPLLEEMLKSLDSLELQINSATKTGKIREYKLKPVREMRQELEKSKRLINLLNTAWKSKCALIDLLGASIVGLFGEDIGKILSKEEGFKQLKMLAVFQKNLLNSGIKKGVLGVKVVAFENFASHLSGEVSTSFLLNISRELMQIMGKLSRGRQGVLFDLEKVRQGDLSFKEYCEQNKIEMVRGKNPREFVSSLYLKIYTLNLVNAFAQGFYSIIDVKLMPLVCKEYTIKRESYNRMVLNWEGLQNQTSVEPHPCHHLSSLNDFPSVLEKIQGDFSQIETDFLLTFGPNNEDFARQIDDTSARDFYSPMAWIDTYRNLTPFLEGWFHEHLSKLSTLKLEYIKMGQQLIEQIPPDQRIAALQEFKELVLQQSLMVGRITLFCTDLRALMDLYDPDELESESYLLPKPLEDLLQLSELDDLIDAGLEALYQSESSSEEETVAEEKIEEPIISAPEAPEKKKNIDEAFSKKQAPAQAKQRSRSRKIPSITIARGAKMRDILKEVKAKLGLTPESGGGSHRIIRDAGHIAVLPYHGGGDTLPRGTAKSLENQLAAIVEQRNRQHS